MMAHRYVRCHQPQGKAGRSANLLRLYGTWALFEALIRQNRLAFDFFCQTSTLSTGIRNLMLLLPAGFACYFAVHVTLRSITPT